MQVQVHLSVSSGRRGMSVGTYLHHLWELQHSDAYLYPPFCTSSSVPVPRLLSPCRRSKMVRRRGLFVIGRSYPRLSVSATISKKEILTRLPFPPLRPSRHLLAPATGGSREIQIPSPSHNIEQCDMLVTGLCTFNIPGQVIIFPGGDTSIIRKIPSLIH